MAAMVVTVAKLVTVATEVIALMKVMTMVNSAGLPMLTGPQKPSGVAIMRTIASSRSST